MTLTAPTPTGVPTSDLAFHRLALGTPGHRWWRPLVVLALAVLLFLAGTLLAVVPLAIVAVVVPGQEAVIERVFDAAEMSDPLAAIVMLLSIAMMLPAALLAVRLAGGRPAGTLSSVTGRLRRPLLLRCLGLAALLVVAMLLLSVTIEGAWQDLAFDERTLPLLGIAVLAVPLQAAAEEYAFRGLLMQTVGAWLRHPAFAIALPVPLFTLGHEYDLLGLVDVTAFALAAGWLTWRTGGLEAAIGLHVANNCALVAFGAFGLVDLDATDGTASGLACSLAVTATYALLVRDRGSRVATSPPRP